MAPRPNKSATHKFHRRRDTIVRAAVEVLNAKGVRGMTLADVAARIDLVPTAVMYYFRKKEELAAACFHKAIEQYEGMIAQAQRGQSAREALEIFVRATSSSAGRSWPVRRIRSPCTTTCAPCRTRVSAWRTRRCSATRAVCC
jgi:AcrR family transcriptional regulator